MISRASLLGAGIAVALVATSGAPARADDEIGLSLDGQTWHDDLSQPLFDPALRWVPGDREAASFYVRNQGPSRAKMTIEVRADDRDQLLANDDIELAGRTAGGAWVPLENGADAAPLLRDGLEQDGKVRVDVRVEFRRDSTNRSMVQSLPLAFRVTLVQAGARDDGSDPGSRGPLPDTGNDVELWLVWLAAALVGAGAALVVAARRKEARDG